MKDTLKMAINNIFKLMSREYWLLVILLIITVNQIHFYYPDEFENILGGHYILQGRLPYTGFFTHHNPGAYFFATPISLLAGQSFVKFRILLGVAYVIMAGGFYFWIRNRFGDFAGRLTMVWLAFVVVGATYWWGQMLLADTLSAYFIAVPVMLLFWVILKGERLKDKDIWIVSILTAMTLLTTFTLLYLALAIYVFTLIWFIRNSSNKVFSKQTLKVIGVLALPYLVFTLYLLVTWSFKEYFYQSVIFNAQYYATLPGGVSVKNPLRVIIVLFYQFFTNFKTILVMTKDLNFGSPFAQTLVLSNAVLAMYFIIERKFFLAAFIWIILTFSIVRSNPYTTAETDYQGMAYHLISIFNGLIALILLWKALKEKAFDAKYLVYGGSFLFLAAYFLFFSLHLSEKYLEKGYQKYMGLQSLIYDRPSVAATLNQLLDKNQYYFLGPFDFENHLYTNAKLASKYIVLIPAMNQSEQIQKELMDDIQINRPEVIVFDTEMRVFGDKPGGFIKGFIDSNYFNLEHLGAPCVNFKATTKWFGSYDFERHFYFPSQDQQSVLKKLWDLNLISTIDPGNVPAFCKERVLDNKLIK